MAASPSIAGQKGPAIGPGQRGQGLRRSHRPTPAKGRERPISRIGQVTTICRHSAPKGDANFLVKT